MKTRLIYALTASLWIPCGLWGAFGAFDGNGSSLIRYGAGNVGLEAEDVTVTLEPASPPATENDRAVYTCRYRLKNLEDKPLTVQVGIPTKRFNGPPPSAPTEAEAAAFIRAHDFRAETNGLPYRIRQEIRPDGEKFASVLLWDMSFGPDETVPIALSYTFEGYRGAAFPMRHISGLPAIVKYPRLPPAFGLSYAQSYGYALDTGDSWAKLPSKMTFTVQVANFEAALEPRGMLPPSHKEKEAIHRAFRNGQYYRMFGFLRQSADWNKEAPYLAQVFTPTADGKAYQLSVAPDQRENAIAVTYAFTPFPRNTEGLKALLDYAENDKFSQEKRKTPTLDAQALKEIADVILEFHGIPSNNPDIQEFVKVQDWYPPENRPPLDPALKEALLRLHRMESRAGASAASSSP